MALQDNGGPSNSIPYSASMPYTFEVWLRQILVHDRYVFKEPFQTGGRHHHQDVRGLVVKVLKACAVPRGAKALEPGPPLWRCPSTSQVICPSST